MVLIMDELTRSALGLLLKSVGIILDRLSNIETRLSALESGQISTRATGSICETCKMHDGDCACEDGPDHG